MKRTTTTATIGVFLAMIFALIVTFRPVTPSPVGPVTGAHPMEENSKPAKPGPLGPAGNAPLDRAQKLTDTKLSLPSPSGAGTEPPKAPAASGFVVRTLSENWTDPPGKPGRRRVRIVEADFKYPFLRFEEAVTRDPAGGEPTVTLQRASVADHLMVGIPAESDGRTEADALAEAGYPVRAIEPGSFLLVEMDHFAAEGDQATNLRRLEALDEFVDFAEPDWLVFPAVESNDPALSSGKLWGLQNDGQVFGTRNDADIDAPEGWNARSTAPEVVVAVTDTGIRYTHEDLAPNMWTNQSGHFGMDAYDGDEDPMDIGGHGTHCAGTIGARGNNNAGIVGVAWEVQLMALRFLGPDGGTTSDAIRVINYARLNGANIISASWGGGGESRGLLQAIEACYAADIPFVAAAGNYQSDNDSMPFYPASYETPNIVSVAATDRSDRLSHFSNYGRTNVDLAAPGSDIWSCGIDSDSSYTYLSGTSMATPHVAGALALAKAHFPDESCEDHITRLYTSADPLPALSTRLFTGGRLNLFGLLSQSSPVVYHDDFDEPLQFYGCHGYWCGDNARMTRESDEDQFSPDTGNKSMWFTWEAPASGLLTFRGMAGGNGEVSVVAFLGQDRSKLKRLADNFDERPTSESRLTFYVEKGESYRFSVDSRSPGGRLIVAELTLRPDNDYFLDARIAPTGDRIAEVGTNCGATAEAFERARPHAGVGQGKSIWWRWTPDFDGPFVLTTRRSDFDTVLAVYTGPNTGNLTEVASNDDRSPTDWTSEVEFEAVAGTTYHLAIDSFRGDGTVVLSGYRKGVLAILAHPEDLEVVLGRTADFEVITSDGELARYQWFKDDSPIPGASRPTLRISNVVASDFGTYHVLVSNGEESVASNPADLTERTLPPKILWQPTSLAYAVGEPLEIRPRIEGSEPLSYQWFRDGDPLPGEVGPSLEIGSLQSSDQGYYQVEVSNPYGGTTSRFINVLVREVPWSVWNWLEPQRAAYDLHDITFAEDRFVAVGDAGTILSSPDAESWTNHTLAELNFRFRRIVYGNGRWLAAGPGGYFAWSDDLDSWHTHVETDWSFASSTFQIFFWKGKFHLLHILSGDSILYSSPDGATWEIEQTFESKFFSQAMTSPDTLVLVEMHTGTIWSSDNARDWTTVTPEGAASIPEIWRGPGIYHDGEFRIWSSDHSRSKRLWRSVDGQTWTSRDQTSESVWPRESSGYPIIKSIGDRVFYTEGTSLSFDKSLKVSEDGILWQQHEVAFAPLSVASGNDSVVVVGDSGHTARAPSWDLLYADIPNPAIFNQTITSIRVLDGRVWAISSRNRMFSSPDGSVWQSENGTSDSFPSGLSFNSLVFANGAYWAGVFRAGLNQQVFRGLHPTQMQEVTGSNLTGVHQLAADGDRMVAFGSDGSPGFFYSDNGIDWTPASMPSDGTSSGESLTHLGDRFMALSDERILSSTDGTSWTSYDTGTRFDFSKQPSFLAHGLGQHLAFSEEGDLWASGNGSSWSRRDLGHLLKGFGDEFSGIAGDENAVVVFTENTGYYSEDLSAWFEFNLPVLEALKPVVFNGALIATTSYEGLSVVLRGGRSNTLAPTVAFRTLVDGGRYLINGQYTIEGDVYDSDGESVETQLYVDGQLAGTSTDDVPTFVWNPNTSGTVELKLVARNAAGTSNQARIAVTVVGSAPVGSAGLFNTHLISAVDDRLLLLGREGTLASSRNGVDWQRLSLPRTTDLDSVVYGKGAYLVGGESVFVSLDGITWTVIPDLEGQVGFDNGWFYVIGPEFLHISADGLNWETLDPPSLNVRDSVVFFEGEQIMVTGRDTVSVSRNLGKLWTETVIPGSQAQRFGDAILTMAYGTIHRTEDWQSWQSLPTPLTGDTRLFAAGGVLFIGSTPGNASSRYGWELGHFSSDGLNWQPISGTPMINTIAYGNGTWIGFGYHAAFRSSDAANWQYVLGDDGTGNRDSLANSSFVSELWTIAHGDEAGFVAVNENGLRATSPDGAQWTIFRGQGQNRYFFTQMTSLDGTLVSQRYSGGSNWPAIWSTDPVEWQDSDWEADGELASMKTVDGRILATTVNGEFGVSDNGRTWQVSTPAGRATLYDATEGGGTYAVLGDRMVHLSNNGTSWQSHALPVRYQKISYFNGEFFAYDSNRAQPLLSRSSDGVTWQAVESVDTATSLRNVDSLSFGNNTVLLHDEIQAVVSTDLTNWSEARAPTEERFKDSAFHPQFGLALLTETDGAFLSDDGLVWHREPLLTKEAERIWADGDQLYVASELAVETLTRNDLELISLHPSRREVGVGQSLDIEVVVKNHGTRPVDLAVATLDLLASRDVIIGNGDDFPLADALRTDAVLGAGEQQTLIFQIEIPTGVAGGEFLVAARIATPDNWIEANLANNTVYTGPGALFIPEWTLDLLADGNGQVNRDLSALRYPHGSRVSLNATAGKGAAFTGWGGDAAGAESQTTIVMDGDKSIRASFSSRATLQVLVRGLGTVQGLANLGSYPVGNTANLTAAAAPGWEFSGWGGAATDDLAATTIIMDGSKAVTANFTLGKASWKSRHFTAQELADPRISGDQSDPDQDGIPTWQEYLHHSDPRSAASTGVVDARLGGGFFYVLFTRNAGIESGLGMTCQGSRNLADWDAPDLQERVLSERGGIETVEARLPVANGSQGYLRFTYQNDGLDR